MSIIKNNQRAADRALKASQAMLLLLILNLVVDHLTTDIEFKWQVFRILVSCLPLCIFIPGLLKARRRTASLLCFALLLYFVAFVPPLTAPGNLLPEIISTLLATLLFTSSMMFSTWQYRADLETIERQNSSASNLTNQDAQEEIA